MNTKNIFNGLFSYNPGQPERAKIFKAFLKEATDIDLAFLMTYGSKAGSIYISGKALQTKEEEAIKRKVKDRETFKGWSIIANGLIDVHTKVLTLHENIFKMSNFMNAMGALWITYNNIANLFSGLMVNMDQIKGDGAKDALSLVQQFAKHELNNIVNTMDKSKLVIYNLDQVDNTVDMDYSTVKSYMEQGSGILKTSLSKMKGFEVFIEDLKLTAFERGEVLHPSYIQDIENNINDCKGCLSANADFSTKRYKQLIEEGNEEEAEAMKERFLFPDYDEVPMSVNVCEYHIKTINVWKQKLGVS